MWRNGIYPFPHYHSQIHEVLGIARGRARVRFGGRQRRGAGCRGGRRRGAAGRHRPSAPVVEPDLLVIGAYPPTGTMICAAAPAPSMPARCETIPRVPLPETDPLFGADGPLTKLWR